MMKVLPARVTLTILTRMALIEQSTTLDGLITTTLHSFSIGRGFEECLLHLATAKVKIGEQDTDALVNVGIALSNASDPGASIWKHEAPRIGWVLYFVGTEVQVIMQIQAIVAMFQVDSIDWQSLEMVFVNGANVCTTGSLQIADWMTDNMVKLPRTLNESAVGMPGSLKDFYNQLISFNTQLEAWKNAIQIRKQFNISENLQYLNALPPNT